MRALLKIALLVISASSLTALAIAEPANTAATEFVRRQHLGGNLKQIGFMTAQKTQTFAMLASKIGISEAKGLVANELDSHTYQFEEQWNENLAKAYAQNFTSEELASLASEGRNSKYVHKLREKQEAVGESIQRMSAPILNAYVTAAMTSAFSKISTK
jgi:hypothetical protein